MKRFASHYLYLTDYGFLKQYIVEINDEGYVSKISLLEEEIESIVWSPGIIILIHPSLWKDERHKEIDDDEEKKRIHSFFESRITEVKQELPDLYQGNIERLELIAVKLYPFNFIRMQPTPDTSIQMLNMHSF